MNPFGKRVTRENNIYPYDYPRYQAGGLDFSPERITQNWALARFENRAVRSVRNGAAVLALSVGLFTGIYSAADSITAESSLEEHMEDIEAAREEIDQNEERVLNADYEAEVNYANVTDNLGETCESFLSNYLPGAELADVSETDIVSDALNTQNLPCGDSPVEIRSDLRELSAATTALNRNEYGALLNESRAELRTLRTKTSGIMHDEHHHQSETGQKVGFAVGLLAAGGAVAATRSKDKYRVAKLSGYLRRRISNPGSYLFSTRIELSQDMARRVKNRHFKD